MFGISLVCYLQFTNKLSIEKTILKEQNSFKITDHTFELRLNTLQDKNYVIVLKYVITNVSDADYLKKLMYTPGKFNVLTQVTDKFGKVIESNTINDGGKLSGGWSREYVEWNLIKFSADHMHAGKIRINFQGNDDLFNFV
jgi:hypothetical protein